MSKNLTLTSNDQNKLLKCPWQFISKLRILDLMSSRVSFGLGNKSMIFLHLRRAFISFLLSKGGPEYTESYELNTEFSINNKKWRAGLKRQHKTDHMPMTIVKHNISLTFALLVGSFELNNILTVTVE